MMLGRMSPSLSLSLLGNQLCKVIDLTGEKRQTDMGMGHDLSW